MHIWFFLFVQSVPLFWGLMFFLTSIILWNDIWNIYYKIESSYFMHTLLWNIIIDLCFCQPLSPYLANSIPEGHKPHLPHLSELDNEESSLILHMELSLHCRPGWSCQIGMRWHRDWVLMTISVRGRRRRIREGWGRGKDKRQRGWN